MRVIVFVNANEDSEAGVMPSEQELADMTTYNEALVKAGIMLAGEGLHPTSKGKRIRFRGDERTVVGGPFGEKSVAGYWIWQVKDLDEAVEWLKRSPFRDGDVDIRPIFEAEDFGDAFSPELRQREEEMRRTIEERH